MQVLVQLILLGLQGLSNLVWKAGAGFGENVSQDLQVPSEYHTLQVQHLVNMAYSKCKI